MRKEIIPKFMHFLQFLHPGIWLRNEITDTKVDGIIKELMEDDTITWLFEWNQYTKSYLTALAYHDLDKPAIHDVWIGNFPYAYGNVMRYGGGLPKRSTVIKFRRYHLAALNAPSSMHKIYVDSEVMLDHNSFYITNKVLKSLI